MADPAAPPVRVRCYECGRREDPRQEACSRCGAVFRGLCPCGAGHSLYDVVCAGCGAALTPKRLPRAKLPLVRAVRWGIAAAVVAGGAAVLFARKADLPAWALKERGLGHYRAARYEEAARDFDRAAQLAPRDAQAWFNLGLARRQLRMAPDAYLPPVRRAVEIDGDMVEARLLLAFEERRAGRHDAAFEHARAAAATPAAGAEAHVFLAEMLLQRQDADVWAAMDELRRALQKDPGAREAKVLLAECVFRLYGSLPSDAYPPEAAVLLSQARDALGPPGAEPASWRAGVLGVRLHLATGRPEEAFAVADRLAGRPAEVGPSEVPAEAEAWVDVLRGRAILAWRGAQARPIARDYFLGALGRSPGRRVAVGIVEDLVRRGDAALAEDVLDAARAVADPAGELSAQVAALRLARGDVPGAREAVGRALDAAPEDAAFLVIDGDVRAAAGDRPGAEQAYRRAAAANAAWSLPRVRLALLVLSSHPVRPEDAARAADALRGESGRTPDVATVVAVARLELAAGRPDRAREAAEASVRLAPGDADAWILLADVRLASDDLDASTDAARAFARARGLRPDDRRVALREAESLLRAGDPASAAAAATAFLSRHPADTAVLEWRIRAAMQLGQWKAAADDLRTLAARPDRSVDHLLLLAQCLARAGDRSGAVRALDEARREAPSGLAESVEILRAQVEGEAPEDLLRRLRTRGATRTLARAELALGDPAAAAVTARRLLADAGGDPVATEVLVLALMDTAPASAAARDESRRVIAALASDAPAWLAPFLEARVLAAEGRWAEADALLRPLADVLPQAAVPVFVAGTVAFRAGRRDAGLDALRRSLRLPGATPALPAQVAACVFEVAADTPDLRRVESLLRETLRLDPGHAAAAFRLSVLLALRGDLAAAAAAAERGLQSPRLAPEEERDLRLQAASAHAAAGNAALAGVHLEALSRSVPDDPRLPIVRGHADLAGGRVDAAEAAFRDAAARAPESPWPRLGLVRCALRRDDPAGALAVVGEWRSARPDDVVVPLAAARDLEAAGRIDEAARVHADLLVAKPGRLDLARLAVELLERNGRAEAAASVARDACGSVPPRDEVAAGLLLVQALVADFPGAAEGLERVRAVLARPDLTPAARLDARILEARALLLAGRAAEARTRADTVLVEVSKAPEADAGIERRVRDVRGLSAVVAEDWAAAAEDLTRCVEIEPRDARALNNAAWALAHVPGRASDGLGLARRATSLRPSLANFWATRGVAAEAAGETEDALASYTEALRRHESEPASDPAGRGRTAIRLARLLRALGFADRSRSVAASVAGFRPEPPPELRAEAAGLATE